MRNRIGTLGGVSIRLADWLPEDEQYQRRYIPVDPQSEFVAAERFGLTADLQTRIWYVRDWSGGEGDTYWDRDLKTYRTGTGVAPVQVAQGVELAAYRIESNNTSGGTFDDGYHLGFGQGSLWSVRDGDAYEWDWDNDRWGDAVTTGAAASEIASIADGEDTWMYSSHVSKAIHRWKSGSNETHVANTVFTNIPVMVNFEGSLYALDGNDLYEIDKTAADTRTLRADTGGAMHANWNTQLLFSKNRLWVSDVGPVWITMTEDFKVFVWEYNVADDTARKIAKLPDFIAPTSIYNANGFTFVGFINGPITVPMSGNMYIWYGRGAQTGVVGPVRGATGRVQIAGMYGDDLVFSVNGTDNHTLWAYNVTSGGIVNLGGRAGVSFFDSSRMFASKCFVCSSSAGDPYSVTFYDFTEYTTSGSFTTGWFDFDYPNMDKVLLDVTVTTDPLPSTAIVDVLYAVDGSDSYTLLTPSWGTDDDTTNTWVISSVSSTVAGKAFEFQVQLSTGSATQTPTIREVSARATGLAHRLEWTLAVDCTTDKSGTQSTEDIIDSLNTLATNRTVVSFADPWQNLEHENNDLFTVTVEEVITPAAQQQAPPVAFVRLRTVSLV